MSRARMLSVLPRCVESDASEVSRATIALVPRHCCSPSLASNSMARDGPVPTKSKVTAKQQKHADILNFSAIFVSLSQYLQLLIVQRSDPDPEGPRDAATNKDGPTSWLPSCGRESPTCHLQRTESPPTRTNESEWIFSRRKIEKKNRKCYTHLYIFIHFYTCLFIHVRPNPDVAPHLQSSWSSSWWSSSSSH